MRIIFNILLVLFGIPVFGFGLMLIGAFFPIVFQFFTWSERLAFFSFLLISLGAFCALYYFRARWLKNVGIFKSWRTFQEYLIENHELPEVSEKEKKDFVKWADLSLKDLLKTPLKNSKMIYYRISNEYKAQKISEEDKKKYTKCLTHYGKGAPIFKMGERIKSLLPKKKGIKYEITDNGIIIRKKNKSGFDIEIFDEDYEFTVICDYDHIHYLKEFLEVMIRDIILLMTKNRRIEVHKVKDLVVRTKIQFYKNKEWGTYSASGYILPSPLWKKKTVKYYQNDLLTAEEAKKEINRVKELLNSKAKS